MIEKLPLSYFIQRAVVLHQYRHLLRATSHLYQRDESMAQDIRVRIREAFRDDVGDQALVKQMISHGTKQLSLLESLAGIKNSKSTRKSDMISESVNESYIGANDQKGTEEQPIVWPWQEKEEGSDVKN